MEGVSHEACSLAGTLKLGKLIAFYDDNGISIDGEVHGWFTDDTPKRFEAYGWHVVRDVDGHDPQAIEAAIAAAKAHTDRPSADLLQDHHRLRRAEQAGHRSDARRRARRRRSRCGPPAARLAARAVRDSRRHSHAAGMHASAAPRREAAVARRDSTPTSATFPRARSRIRAARCSGELPGSGAKSCRATSRRPRRRRRPGHASGVAAGAQCLRTARARAARRLGRPDRLEQHESQGLAVLSGDDRVGQLPSLRRARIRHGRDHERHGAARRAHSLRRHVPRVLRLRAQRACACPR